MDGGLPAGGSVVLAGLIEDHGGELAADLLREYQLDIRETLKPETDQDPSWVLILAEQLPHHSSFKASLSKNPESAYWSNDTYLLAETVNQLRSVVYAVQAVQADPKQRKKIPLPDPVYLPGERKKQRQQNDFTKTAAKVFAEVRGN